VDASNGKLIGEVSGEVETTDDGVLIIRRIHVHYRLEASAQARELVERVHGFHARKCPVFRSLEAAIEISTSWELTRG